MQLQFDRKKLLRNVIAPLLLIAIFCFVYNLQPLGFRSEAAGVPTKFFIVESGAGFNDIVNELKHEGLIRSSFVFKTLALLEGEANNLKAGRYRISSTLSSVQILYLLVQGARREIQVTILEGSTVYEIDDILSREGILPQGALVEYAKQRALEGHLFPDTYRFFTESSAQEVTDKFSENFAKKAAPLLGEDPRHAGANLILASLLEKEVPDFEERQIVAGIIKKRFDAGMPLQIDTTICYAKQIQTSGKGTGCHPLTPLDFKINSPYNTCLYPGWPPGPVGNPGESALKAAISPKKSPYWYYLSDPVTKKTIFAQTLDEHNQNRFKYLK